MGKRKSFSSLGVCEEIAVGLPLVGVYEPTKVQCLGIPIVLKKQDVVCQSSCGQGKTLAYVLPILTKVRSLGEFIFAAVVCPTREVAIQVYGEFLRFRRNINIVIEFFVGGVNLERDEKSIFDKRPSIVIGTPGRLCNLVRRKILLFDKLNYLVVDECDKIFSQCGMREEILFVIRDLKVKPCFVFIGATLNDDCLKCFRSLSEGLTEVLVEDSGYSIQKKSCHFYLSMEGEFRKNRKLFSILDGKNFNRALVFVRTQERAEALSIVLGEVGYNSNFIHGSIPMCERFDRIMKFRSVAGSVLVSTDLLSRGIDILGIDVIVNFDLPNQGNYNVLKAGGSINMHLDTFLHRCGRIFRFGSFNSGITISFVCSKRDAEFLNDVMIRYGLDICEMSTD